MYSFNPYITYAWTPAPTNKKNLHRSYNLMNKISYAVTF